MFADRRTSPAGDSERRGYIAHARLGPPYKTYDLLDLTYSSPLNPKNR